MNAISETQIDRIRTLAAELDTLGKTALERVIEAGHLLIECKAELNHGEWLPWLKKNFTFSERTAHYWISIAKAEVRGDLKSATVADLGIREALRLAKPETAGEQLIEPVMVDYTPPANVYSEPDKCMEVPRGFLKAVSKDETRYAICGIRVDANGRRIVATTGMAMAVIDIPGNQKIVDGWISKEQWMAASAASPSGMIILLEYTKGRIGGVKYNTAGDEVERFPNGETVSEIMTPPVKSRDIILDYKLLNRLCLSLAESKGETSNQVIISIPEDESDKKIVVTVGGKTGVMMLCHQPKTKQQEEAA